MLMAGGSPRQSVQALCVPAGRWAEEVRSMSATAEKITASEFKASGTPAFSPNDLRRRCGT